MGDAGVGDGFSFVDVDVLASRPSVWARGLWRLSQEYPFVMTLCSDFSTESSQAPRCLTTECDSVLRVMAGSAARPGHRPTFGV